MSRNGLAPITTEHGLALFDAALTYQQPNLLASAVNRARWPARPATTPLAPILSALTTSRPQAATASPHTLAARLAIQAPEQQLQTLTTLVNTATATVLAHPDPAGSRCRTHFSKSSVLDSLDRHRTAQCLGPTDRA